MNLSKIRVTIKGIVPLLMHSSRLANPMNETAKAMKKISAKRKKTDDDFAELAKLEWHGSAYADSEGYPCLTNDQLDGVLQAGARKAKLGQVFKSSVFVTNPTARLRYGKDLKMEDLWGVAEHVDVRSVAVQRNRVMRTRPVFPTWGTTFEVGYYSDQVDRDQVVKALEDGGALSGVGDFRPKFGRFTVEKVENI